MDLLEQLEDHIQQLLNTLCNRESADSMNSRWEQVLKNFYESSRLEKRQQTIEHCQLLNRDNSYWFPPRTRAAIMFCTLLTNNMNSVQKTLNS